MSEVCVGHHRLGSMLGDVRHRPPGSKRLLLGIGRQHAGGEVLLRYPEPKGRRIEGDGARHARTDLMSIRHSPSALSATLRARPGATCTFMSRFALVQALVNIHIIVVI